MRCALYYTPAPDHPLTRAAAVWLGRDAFGGAVDALPDDVDAEAPLIAAATAEPRRYGFHATLKAPFRLAAGATLDGLEKALDEFVRAMAPVDLGLLEPRLQGGFLALFQTAPNPAVDDFAGAVVRAFEPFRAPLTEAEIARRRPETLDPTEFRYLHRWGYPFVLDKFRFHMTLTGRLDDGQMQRLTPLVDRAFGAALEAPLVIDALALFVQPDPGAPFMVARRLGLGGEAEA